MGPLRSAGHVGRGDTVTMKARATIRKNTLSNRARGGLSRGGNRVLQYERSIRKPRQFRDLVLGSLPE